MPRSDTTAFLRKNPANAYLQGFRGGVPGRTRTVDIQNHNLCNKYSQTPFVYYTFIVLYFITSRKFRGNYLRLSQQLPMKRGNYPVLLLPRVAGASCAGRRDALSGLRYGQPARLYAHEGE